jgi:hypothetical protein
MRVKIKMSNEADGNAGQGGYTLAERGCLVGQPQRSDRFCNQCIYSPLKNLWPTIKDRQELRNKRNEQLNKFAPTQGRAWACVMQCEEHVEEPWVDLVIEASIKHQIKYTNKKELGDTEEAVRRNATRMLQCQPAPGQSMLCASCASAVREHGSTQCKSAFDNSDVYNMVLK